MHINEFAQGTDQNGQALNGAAPSIAIDKHELTSSRKVILNGELESLEAKHCPRTINAIEEMITAKQKNRQRRRKLTLVKGRSSSVIRSNLEEV
jgi:hypothetical protein